jgi:hypothetical protein
LEIGSPNGTQVLPSKRANWIALIRREIARARGNRDPGQTHPRVEILEGGSLLHDVFAAQVVAALLEHLDQRPGDGVAEDVGVVDQTSVRIVAFMKARHAVISGSLAHLASVGSLP